MSRLACRAVGAAALVVIAFAAAALSGCAGMLPKLVPPKLDVIAISVSSGNLARARIGVQLHVVNPNARAIAVNSIDCRVAVAGTELAQGATTAPFVVPANGETQFGVQLNVDLAAALAIMAAQLGAADVPYTLNGEAHLSEGLIRTLPFKSEGHLRLR
jgi:LEA14-like dessication related protein